MPERRGVRAWTVPVAEAVKGMIRVVIAAGKTAALHTNSLGEDAMRPFARSLENQKRP